MTLLKEGHERERKGQDAGQSSDSKEGAGHGGHLHAEGVELVNLCRTIDLAPQWKRIHQGAAMSVSVVGRDSRSVLSAAARKGSLSLSPHEHVLNLTITTGFVLTRD